ncbi:uncharacterized protein RCC_04168 [Ramularia collo-cygni]|uniref:Uncharacterized protein n=1 Tax=Ramularia collo-cygni TaxID=112498 RepID=A0A2D3V6Z9_9PEZI|nr:uncharacterized protein RCC_04168 [Ramularia collo-cygni]CZT18324.1 uncharacterized protein RCC_04168 [Ramularia collo-cygni]
MYAENMWSKAFWIPFWTLQLVSASIFLAISAVSLGIWRSSGDDYDYGIDTELTKHPQRLDSAVNVVSGVFIGISALTIAMNGIEIILFARKRLSAVSVVVFNSVTTALWLGMVVLLALAAVGGAAPVFTWIVIIVAFAASTGKLAYGSVILHRSRKRFTHRKGAYTSAAAAVESGLDSSPSGPHTAYNAHDTALRHVAPSAYQHSSGAADEYYDPESMRSARCA